MPREKNEKIGQHLKIENKIVKSTRIKSRNNNLTRTIAKKLNNHSAKGRGRKSVFSLLTVRFKLTNLKEKKCDKGQ